jgi:hypothetical protein
MIDALLEAIVTEDPAGVRAALRDRSEAERAHAARIVVPAMAQEGYGWFERGNDGGLEWRERVGYDDGDREWRQSQVLQVAALGTATLKELRGIGAWRLSFSDPAVVAEVLLDRRAPWTNAFVAWFLRAESWQSTWPHVRPLIRAGLAERPDEVTYLNGLIAATRRDDSRAAALLARDPDLVETELWELLAFDAGDDSMTAADAADAGWGEAIQAWAADGRIDRDRLLDALLGALQSDLSAYRSTWHRRLWRDLKPTAAERAARTDGLRTLLGAAAPQVVAFAVEELARIKPVPQGLEHELGPALTAPAKKTVRTALKLLDRIDSPDRPGLASLALAHEAAGIQGEVLDRLERWGADHDVLLERLELVSATQRPRAEALLGFARPASDDVAPEVDVAAIPEAISAALNFGGPVPPAPIPGEPVLGEPIAPIETPDELAVALSERRSRTDERLLDAVLRRCDQPFEGPLRACAAWLNLNPDDPPAWPAGAEQPEFDEPGLWDPRRRAAMARVLNRTAGPLLALPTHAGGWIEPQALVERLRQVGDDVDEPELTQALLRLAPGGRDAAFADGLPGRPGALLRCALGGPAVEGGDLAAVAARAVREPPLEPAPAAQMFIDVDSWSEYRARITAPPALAALYERPWPSRPVDPLLWPARRDLTCAIAIPRVAWAIEFAVGSDRDIPQLLELLLHPGEPLTALAIQLVSIALCALEPAIHLLAADVVIAAMEDGRLDAANLAAPLVTDLTAGMLPTHRLGARLASIATAGPLHAAVVRDLLDAIVPALEGLPTRTYAPLLEAFDELCAQTQTGPDAARPFLQRITGSSKAAKAAKSLLARDGAPPPREATLALAARVRRAERWLSAR